MLFSIKKYLVVYHPKRFFFIESFSLFLGEKLNLVQTNTFAQVFVGYNKINSELTLLTFILLD